MTSPLLPAPPSPVLVVGAGFLGSRVAAAIPGEVIATTRSGTWRGGQPPENVRLRALDILQHSDAQVNAALEGARAIVVCFAAGRTQPREALYIDGAQRLLDACADRAPALARVVYTSSTSALPDHDGWLDDDCEAWPDSARGRVQRAGEQRVRERCEALGLPWIILRLGGLYGPGRGIGRIYRSRGQHEGALEGDGMQATNLIHVRDATRCVLVALRLDPARCGVINVCADDHRARRDMYQRAAELTGAPSPRWAEEPTPGRGVYGKRVRNARMKDWLGLELEFAQHDVATA